MKVEILISGIGFLALMAFSFTHTWLHLLAGSIGYGYSFGLILRELYKEL